MKEWGVKMKNYSMKYHFNQNPKEPESATRQKNEQAYAKEKILNEEQKNVLKGHCYESYCHIGKGGEVWDPEAYAFLNYRSNKAKSGIISPELKENAKLYRINGLFEVVPGKVYQVRGYDSSNLTLIRTLESKNNQFGWVVINCLQSRECTYEALKLADAYFRQKSEGERLEGYCVQGNIKAIILTEAQEACYGGIKAVLYYNQGCKTKAEEASYQLREDITILAGDNWFSTCMEDAVYDVNVMARKESMAYGMLLEAKENGKVMVGMGQGASNGTKGFLRPGSIFERSCECFVRGLRLQIQVSKFFPGAYHLYFPDYHALWMSHFEIPFYQLNGTYRFDWENIWEYYMEACTLFKDAKVLLQTNGWPHWDEGEGHLQKYIKKRASLLKYWHDETILYANMGYTVEEIAQKIGIPKSFDNEFLASGTKEECLMYVKAVYNKHYGWYDGNPVHFARLDRKKHAVNCLKYFRENSLDIALEEYENGNYQEVAEILEMALLAEPSNQKVRYLLADCLEQLGYQASYGALRNAYLSGAYELRNPNGTGKLAADGENRDLISLLTPEMFLEKLSIAYHAESEEENWEFEFYIQFSVEEEQYYRVIVMNGCIMYQKEVEKPLVQLVELNRKQMFQILSNLGKRKCLQEALPVTENKELNQNIRCLFAHMINLSEYRGYAVMEENIRGCVISCKNMLVRYYDKVKKAEKKTEFELEARDMKVWQEEYYPKLVEETYMGFPRMKGLPKNGVFHKYEYFGFLYGCFRYLARYCKDTEDNRKVIRCIQILEPYLERFEGETFDSERTVFFNVFDFHAVMEEVKKMDGLGIACRDDGKITACELTEFLMEGYWYLFEN